MLNILGYVLASGQFDINMIESAFQQSPGELELCLADLAAIIKCEPFPDVNDAQLKFLHASLPDLFYDKRLSVETVGYEVSLCFEESQKLEYD